jgi:hypothetical protein
MIDPNPIFKLPAKRILGVLAELQSQRDRPLPLPEMTVLLTSGAQVRGELIQFVAEGPLPADHWLLLRNVTAPLDVTYLSLSEIEALTLHLTEETLHLLSFGKLKPLAAKVPTRVELERLVRTLSAEFSLSIAILWEDLPTSDLAFQNLGELLLDLQLILTTLLEDELGVAAVREQIRQVTIRSGLDADVSLEGGNLVLQGVGQEDFVCLDQRVLARAIEARL